MQLRVGVTARGWQASPAATVLDPRGFSPSLLSSHDEEKFRFRESEAECNYPFRRGQPLEYVGVQVPAAGPLFQRTSRPGVQSVLWAPSLLPAGLGLCFCLDTE